MSSAIKKKKTHFKPRGYEDKLYAAKVARHIKASDECFSAVFSAMQMSSLYVLFYDFDFSKQKLKNFNEKLRKNNVEIKGLSYDGAQKAEDNIKKNLRFDCLKEAENFPYRIKMKMFGRSPKQNEIRTFTASVNAAIESYLILSVTTLHKNYRFSGKQVREWWKKVLELSQQRIDGLTDEHIREYFMLACDLDITE